ncbi:response regulator [Asticcacaulis sp. EMRT-3]|uniref:response regulator n=1 Tax=Asticcacaulis sp. EMRT-3 TaxID=3040349 RepID=UPI0024AF624E|nr:response regulator [Asticcacaulis sp. EMRT-3]MDI7776149.1 response regulator [Asticcacaulis sp. EMRT-3]
MKTPFTLVLVEDDEGHARLIGRNLQRVGVLNPLVRLKNGAEALDYFLAGAASAHSHSVVVLDLNLPDIDGFEILRRLKSDPASADVPVIVLTTTDHPSDIDRCYALGCNGFMTKPVHHNDFAEAIRKLGLSLTTVRVPHFRDKS